MTTPLSRMLKSLRLVPGGSGGAKLQPQPLAIIAPVVALEPYITLAEVALHDDYTDCWVVIYDRVYDVTPFLDSHPGGADVLMDHAGRDATLAFHDTGHSGDAVAMMRNYLIGELPPEERLFRTTKSTKILSSGIPE